MLVIQVPFTSEVIGTSWAWLSDAARVGNVRSETLVAVGAQTLNFVALFEYVFPKSLPVYVYLAANSGESNSFAWVIAGFVGMAVVGAEV